MNVVSTTDTPEQVAAALEAHGYEAITSDPPAAPSAAPTGEQVVTPPVESTTDPVTETGTPAQAPAGEPKPKPSKKHSAQERIDELTREKYELKGALQSEIDRLKAQLQGTPPAAEATPPPEAVELKRPERPKLPKQSSFETLEEFDTAMEAYEAAQPIYEDALSDFNKKKVIQEFQNEQQQQQAQATVAAVHEAGKTKFDDYETVVLNNDAVQISGALLDAIFEEDSPEDFFHYIGTHPDEAKQFVQLTQYDPKTEMHKSLAANRNAARITSNIKGLVAGTAAPVAAAAAPPVATPVPKPRTSSAPAPIAPLRGSSGSAVTPDATTRVIGSNGWTAAKERALMQSRRNGR